VQPSIERGHVQRNAGQVCTEQFDGVQRGEYGDVLEVTTAIRANLGAPEVLLSCTVEIG
jgi:hypothetical protein